MKWDIWLLKLLTVSLSLNLSNRGFIDNMSNIKSWKKSSRNCSIKMTFWKLWKYWMKKMKLKQGVNELKKFFFIKRINSSQILRYKSKTYVLHQTPHPRFQNSTISTRHITLQLTQINTWPLMKWIL
jgi:hypothetical protein